MYRVIRSWLLANFAFVVQIYINKGLKSLALSGRMRQFDIFLLFKNQKTILVQYDLSDDTHAAVCCLPTHFNQLRVLYKST
jgi:hypothetical protein